MTVVPDRLHPEVRALLVAFAEGAKAALGSRLVGLYLFGSALTDDFDPASSDLDFLGVTSAPLEAAEVGALADLHCRLAARSSWGDRLEGAYAARDRLRPWGIEGRVTAVGPDGGFQSDAPSDYSADNMAALREHGLELVGPPPEEVVPEVDRATLEAGLRAYLAELLERPFESASAEQVASWTLNVARCLYGIQTGRTSTKREAAEWLATRAPETKAVLAAALAVRAGTAGPADAATLAAKQLAVAQQALDLVGLPVDPASPSIASEEEDEVTRGPGDEHEDQCGGNRPFVGPGGDGDGVG